MEANDGTRLGARVETEEFTRPGRTGTVRRTVDERGRTLITVREERADLAPGARVTFVSVEIGDPQPIALRVGVALPAPIVARTPASAERAATAAIDGAFVVSAPPAIARRPASARPPSARHAERDPADYYVSMDRVQPVGPRSDEAVAIEASAPGLYLLAFASGAGNALRHFEIALRVPWDANGPLTANEGSEFRQSAPAGAIVAGSPYSLGIGVRTAWRAELTKERADRVALLWEANRLVAAQEESGLWHYDSVNAFLHSSFALPMERGFYDDRTTAAAVRLLLAANRIGPSETLQAAARRAIDAYLVRFPRATIGHASIPYSYLSASQPSHTSILAFNHVWEAVLMLLDAAADLDERSYRDEALSMLVALGDLGRTDMDDGHYWYGLVPIALAAEVEFHDANGEVVGTTSLPLGDGAAGGWSRIRSSFATVPGTADAVLTVYRGEPGRGTAWVRNLSLRWRDGRTVSYALDTLDGIGPRGSGARVQAPPAHRGTLPPRPALRIGDDDSEDAGGFVIGPLKLAEFERLELEIEVLVTRPLFGLWGPSPYQDLDHLELEMIRARLAELGLAIDWIDRALENAARWTWSTIHPAGKVPFARMSEGTVFEGNAFARSSPRLFAALDGTAGRGVELPLHPLPEVAWHERFPHGAATFGDITYFRGIDRLEDGPLAVAVSPDRTVSFGKSTTALAVTDAQLQAFRCRRGVVECELVLHSAASGARLHLCARGGATRPPTVASAAGWSEGGEPAASGEGRSDRSGSPAQPAPGQAAHAVSAFIEGSASTLSPVAAPACLTLDAGQGASRRLRFRLPG